MLHKLNNAIKFNKFLPKFSSFWNSLYLRIWYANSKTSRKHDIVERGKTFEGKFLFVLFAFDVAQSRSRLFFVYLICIASYQPVPCLKSILHSHHIFYLKLFFLLLIFEFSHPSRQRCLFIFMRRRVTVQVFSLKTIKKGKLSAFKDPFVAFAFEKCQMKLKCIESDGFDFHE